MKRLFLLAVVALLGLAASAQVEQGFRNGLQINLGMTNVQGEGDDFSFGYGVNWLAEYNFNSNLFLQSGLGIQNISHKEDLIDGALNAYYLQLPIHIGYRFYIKDSTSLFIQAGPTLAYGIAGSDIDWYNGGSDGYFDLFKRFDLQLGARVGVEVSRIKISLGFDYGVINPADIGDYHNLNLNLGIGYMF